MTESDGARMLRTYSELHNGFLWKGLLLALIFLAGLKPALPQASAARFERVGPYGGSVRSLLVDSSKPNVVYLGTSDGQIFKSFDSGSTWAQLFPGIGRRQFVIDTLVQNPENPDHIYAGAWDLRSTGGGLFESLDAGRSWAAMTLPSASAVRGFAICQSDPSRMIVATLAAVYVSSDSGKSWTQVGGSELEKAESAAIDPVDWRLLYVGNWRLGYRSTDFGATWSRVERGIPLDSDLFSLAIDSYNPEVIYASACSGILRSADRGASWTRLRVLPNRFAVRAQLVYIDPVNPHRIYGGTTEGLFVSQNDGKDWTRITPADLVINAMQVDPRDSRKILLGTEHHGVLRSEDRGHTWVNSNEGFVHRQISRMLADSEKGGRVFAGILSDGKEGGFYSFDNQQNQWASVTAEIAPKLEVLCLLPLPGKLGFLAGTTQGLYRRQLPSSPWIKLDGAISKLVVSDLALDGENSWIFAGTSDGVYRARPERLQFQRPPETRLAPRVASLAVSNSTPTIVYAGTSLGVIRSRDHGATWAFASSGLPERRAVESLATCPTERDHLFAGTMAGMFESRDAGESWQKASDSRLGVDVPSIIFLDRSGQQIMVADRTFGGVFLSADGGVTWEKVSAPEFSSPVRSLVQDPMHPALVYVGTNSEGVYRLRLPGFFASSLQGPVGSTR